jgi:hypothetical protein
MTAFYGLRFEAPPTWRARSPYLYPPGTGCPSYTTRHWVPFPSPPTTRRATVEVFDRASTRGRLRTAAGARYIASARTAQKTPLPTVLLLRACLLRQSRDGYRVIAQQRTCLQSRSLSTAVSACFTTLAFAHMPQFNEFIMCVMGERMKKMGQADQVGYILVWEKLKRSFSYKMF